MPAVRKTRLMSAVWRIHPHLYRMSRGRIGGRIGALDVLVLTTVGRSSGKPRAVALMGFDDGDRIVVCGSNAGEPRDPAWVQNLRAEPDATVERGALTVAVTAHEASGDERDRLWTRLLELDPAYAEYARRTTRTLPIVVLSPGRPTSEAGSAARHSRSSSR